MPPPARSATGNSASERPAGTAKALLKVLDKAPETALKILG
jgi:hypothetical protein